MSTSQAFIDKLFHKSDQAAYLYKDYDYSKLSPEEINFIKELKIFSTYKFYIKRLINKSTSFATKYSYIDVNSNYLEYEEYVRYERAKHNYNEVMHVGLEVFISSVIFLTLFNIARKPSGYSYKKDLWKVIALSLTGSIGYIMYYRTMHLKPEICNLYERLSGRLNNNPSLISGEIPENSKKNYFNFK